MIKEYSALTLLLLLRRQWGLGLAGRGLGGVGGRGGKERETHTERKRETD